ncbi:MAG: hypothetical protein IT464_09155 [Planctomycetes bacterium]|nr:hypothetical protein [Planctomycetota bacterium]
MPYRTVAALMLVLLLSGFGCACSAALVAASSVFESYSGTYPVVPSDIDYWSSPPVTVICGEDFAGRITVTFESGGDSATIRHQTYNTMLGVWVTTDTEEVKLDGVTTVTFEGTTIWFGTSANNSYTHTADTPLIAFGFAGNDTITGGDHKDFIYGGLGNDTLSGGADGDWIWGGPGDDELNGGAGNDYLHLGDGEDQTAKGGAGEDTIWGGPGNDTLCGKEADEDEEDGDGGDKDKIFTVGGNDNVWAGPGFDRIYVATYANPVGLKKIVGGPGSDEIYLFGCEGYVYGDYASTQAEHWSYQGADIIYVYGSHQSLGYSIICGEEADTVFNGGANADTMDGEDGNDEINAGGGNDKNGTEPGILGGDGDDLLWGNAGNDIIEGGKGNDQIWGGLGQDKLNGEDGNDRVAGDDGTDDAAGTGDDISGGADDDVIWAEGGADTCYGNDGDDKLYGGLGADTLNGNAGHDTLVDWTSGVVDTLRGGDGDDTLDTYNSPNDNPTADVIEGQGDADRFYLNDQDVDDFSAFYDHFRDYTQNSGEQPVALW